MKEPSFEKKLASYLALATSILAANAGKADAQIMYTDVNPDRVINNDSSFLDLNNDGVFDFNLIQQSIIIFGAYSSAQFDNFSEVIGENQNSLLIGCGYSNAYPLPILNSDTINGLDQFGNNISNHVLFEVAGTAIGSSSTNSSLIGCFNGADKYLGLKVISNGETHYGWARLTVNEFQIVLKDYAINTIPDSAIIVGEIPNCNLPTVTSQPNGNQNICVGDTLPISLQNTDGLTIQWLYNGQYISNAIDSTILISSDGHYEVLVSDSNCFNLISLVNFYSSSPPVIIASNQNATCGNFNGAINISLLGGTPPFSFLWNNGSTDQSINGLSPGSYTVTVTNPGCASTSSNININNSSFPPVLSETHFNSNCLATGSIDISVSSGAPPYSYHWNNGGTIEDRINLPSGNYSVTVTDVSGCSVASPIISINIYSLPPTLNETHFSSDCTNNGSIDISAIAGTPPFIYHWNNGVRTEDRTNLASGNYSVTVTDVNGCTAILSILISGTPNPVPQINHAGDLLSTTIYNSYQWILNTAPIIGATNQQYLASENGIYQVQVTDSNGCVGGSYLLNFIVTSDNNIQSPEINILIDPKYLQVIFPNEKFIGSQLQMFNAAGELVSEMVAIKNTELISIEQLPRGIYILSIRNGDVISNYKIAIL